MIETLAYGYSSESTQSTLSILVLWMIVASALEGLASVNSQMIKAAGLIQTTLLYLDWCGPLISVRIRQNTDYAYCRTHNVSVCLYIAYIACSSVSLYINTLYFFLTVMALSAAATVANIKIRYDAKIPQFAIFGTRVIYVFYSIGIICIGRERDLPICPV